MELETNKIYQDAQVELVEEKEAQKRSAVKNMLKNIDRLNKRKAALDTQIEESNEYIQKILNDEVDLQPDVSSGWYPFATVLTMTNG